MEIRQLSEAQFLHTMGSKMVDATESAEVLADLWSYAEGLLRAGLISGYGFRRRLVEAVYENTSRTYQHILLFTDQKNVYVAVVVDMVRKTVLGHALLDLEERYGLGQKTPGAGCPG